MPVSSLRSAGSGCSERRRPIRARASAGPARRRRARRAARCRRESRTPRTQGRPPLREPPTRPRHADAFAQLDARVAPERPARRAHSNVVRRHARSTTSSSAGSGSNPIPGGAMSASAISRTPGCGRRSSTSGKCARSTSRRRARKACEWRSCGTPPRRHVRNASSGVVHVGAHVALEHQHAREVTRQQPGSGESCNAAAQHDGGSRRDRFETRHRRGDTGSGQPCRVRRCLERARRVGSARGS